MDNPGTFSERPRLLARARLNLLAEFMTSGAGNGGPTLPVAIDAGLHLHGENRLHTVLCPDISMAGRAGYTFSNMLLMAKENEIGQLVDRGHGSDHPRRRISR